MPVANRWSRDPTDPEGDRARLAVIYVTEATQAPVLGDNNSFMPTMELPHAHALDPRCRARLCGHPRRDSGQSRPRGGVPPPPDSDPDAPAVATPSRIQIRQEPERQQFQER